MGTENGKMMAFALLAENRCGYPGNHTDKLGTKSKTKTVVQGWTVNVMKNKEPSAMDCWYFIAPILPITDDFSQSVYVKTFYAFKLLEDEEKKKNGKIDR